MTRELSFHNLPFIPVEGQVIYVEREQNKKLNKFINNNYDWLRKTFREQGLDFCYLPLLAKETLSYNAPYMTKEERDAIVQNVPSIADCLVGKEKLSPSLVLSLDIPLKDKNEDIILQAVSIRTKWYIRTKSTFKDLARVIRDNLKSHEIRSESKNSEFQYEISHDTSACLVEESEPSKSVLKKKIEDIIINSLYSSCEPSEDDGIIRFSMPLEYADEDFDTVSKVIIDEIKERIEALRNRGVNTMFLHNLIDEGEKLSRIKITKDYRIILPDYSDLEIKMSELPKAVFFLFLRHPEGIRFKELPMYYSELLEIYLKMNPIGSKVKNEYSIHEVTDPYKNSINEKCAQIRQAFISKFDERFAKHYYITGKRGEPKGIMLDQSMIIWENDD